MSDDPRVEPAEVYYEPVAQNLTTSCQFCWHFRVPTDCTKVAGNQVSPLGWCELWTAIEPRSDATWNESDHPRAKDGKFGSGGGSASTHAENVASLPDLKQFAEKAGELPPDDDEYEYYHHSIRTRGQMESILEHGLDPERGGGVNRKVTWLSKGDLRNSGGGYVVVRVPRGKTTETSGETEIGGKKLPEWTIDGGVPKEDIVSVVKEIQISAGGHSISEKELAKYAAEHQGEDNPDLPEKYQKWFHLNDRKDATIAPATTVADDNAGATRLAAGIMYVTKDGRVLLLRRTDTGEWAFPGGSLEPGETAIEAAVRESKEEIGRRPDPDDLYMWTRRIARGWDFTTFLNRCGEPFEPVLNDEHDAYAWERLGDHVGASMEALGFVNG